MKPNKVKKTIKGKKVSKKYVEGFKNAVSMIPDMLFDIALTEKGAENRIYYTEKLKKELLKNGLTITLSK